MPRSSICLRCLSTIPADAGDGLCEVCRATPAAEHPTWPGGRLPHDQTPTYVDDPGDAGSDPAAPPAVPGYDMFGLLGRGGMGVVYKARQRGLGRTVAVKVIHAHGSAPIGLRARFATEAAALGRLNHPNIVQVYEVGRAEGRPFIAMEYAPGGPLSRRVAGGPPDPAAAARLVETLAGAIAAAHAAGVLHRDLKPSNVLLDADGVPKVSDFGLAKIDGGSDDSPTYSGALIGTPSYMAPEQAAGRPEDIDERTDVHALGAILFELLTGRPPYQGPNPVAVGRLVLDTDPPRPRALRPEVPAGLEAVCLKCLAKAPADRYPTAAALADDLAAWREGRPTVARPVTAAGRVWRAVRGPAAVAAVLALVVIGRFAVPAPAAREEAVPPGERIAAELAAGRTARLVGPAALPDYQAWPLGEAKLKAVPAADGAAGFDALKESFLALAPGTIRDSYRLRAEVRQLSRPHAGSAVGVFFGYEGHPLPSGQGIHRARVVRFKDAEPVARPADPKTPLYTAQVAERAGVIDPKGNSGWSEPNVAGGKIPPSGERRGLWRTLVIDVTQAGLTAGFEADDGSIQVFACRTADELRATAGNLTHFLDGHAPGHGVRLGDWPPRGPVGIWANHSSVAFRSVTLGPIPGAEIP